MNIKTPTLINMLVLLIFTTPVNAQVIFSDSFESKDMATTNTDGFKWGGLNRTSIVTQDPDEGSVAVFNGNQIHTVVNDGRNWSAYDGDHSLRFRYPAGSSMTEQRYDLGAAYPELWISYWIRVPTNFYRSGNSNNKWFNIWMAPMNGYSTPNITNVEMQDWPPITPGNMDMRISLKNGAIGKFKNSNLYHDFIKPADSGRWMHIVYHVKASSTNDATATDGLVRMYRRWAAEEEYTLINDLSNTAIGIGEGSISTNRLGWGAGYIMGYANSPYPVDTEWLLDDFKVSKAPLLITASTPVARPARLTARLQ